jgi:methylmalonyl-CoA/ethylmalonyl-CoA epimerase
MFAEIREVSVAVRDFDASITAFRTMTGVEPRAVQEHTQPPIQARTASFPVGGSAIALMQGIGDDSPVGRFIAKRGEGLFSIGVAVDDLGRATRELVASGASLVLPESMEFTDFATYDGVYPRVRMNFTRPSTTHGVLFELQQLGPD